MARSSCSALAVAATAHGYPTTHGTPALREAIAGMEQAYADGQEALRNGDFAAYDEAQKELKRYLEQAAAAQPEGGSADLEGN